jgi:hypothetical protein
MKEGDLVVRFRDRITWTEAEKRYHHNMPWLAEDYLSPAEVERCGKRAEFIEAVD